MQVVIEIDDNLYVRLYDNGVENYNDALDIEKAIRKGTPLPKGHGRLIDADALVDSLSSSDRDIYCKAIIEEDAPTIIAADNESEV